MGDYSADKDAQAGKLAMTKGRQDSSKARDARNPANGSPVRQVKQVNKIELVFNSNAAASKMGHKAAAAVSNSAASGRSQQASSRGEDLKMH